MSRVVFVGNIPFEMTEEQIIDIFKEVGPVISFRLMFDRETGKPRGFGFCEFADPETASSAIRNLNGYDLGGRNLVVNTADNDSSPSNFASNAPPVAPPTVVPPQPVMTGTPSFGIEAVNSILGSLSNQQICDIIMQFKNLANNNPTQASHIFQANPALAYAVFQSLLNMKLVDPTLVQELFSQQQGLNPAMNQEAPVAMESKTPPMVSPVAAPPSPEEQQRAMIAQILSLTDEQIKQLPDQQRQQVLLIREQYSRQK